MAKKSPPQNTTPPPVQASLASGRFTPMVTCAGCACPVLLVAGQPVSPVHGLPHNCPQVKQRWQVLQGWLAGKGVMTRVTLPDGEVEWMLMELADGVTLEELEGQELRFEVKAAAA